MIVRFQDSFRDICEKNFSISEEDVRYVVFNPDGKRIVKTGGSSRLYFFGRPLSKEYHLLVEGQWLAPDLKVIAAFKAYPDLLVNVNTREPLEALRALAGRFGVPIQIGKHTDKFIISRSFELRNKEDRLLKIATGKNGQHLAQTMHSSFRREGGKTFLDVSLAYCLDIDKMVEYVKAHVSQRRL